MFWFYNNSAVMRTICDELLRNIILLEIITLHTRFISRLLRSMNVLFWNETVESVILFRFC